jgi:hypothetical protein
MSAPRGAASQYNRGVNNRAVERLAAQQGYVEPGAGTKKTIYFYHNTGEVVGYDGGRATTWVRAEITSNVLHGFPIHPDNLPPTIRRQAGL